MPDNLTTYSIPHDPEATALYWQDRAICVPQTAPEAVAPEPDVDEPDEPQQAELPSGPTHVAARRTADQLASASKFLAAAGRVKFDTGLCTLRGVWMAVAYYASLGDGRVCFASLQTIGDRALVSRRTVRYHLVTLAGHGLIHADHRKGGPAPTTWSIHELSPSVCGGKDCRGGRQRLPGGAAKVAAEVSNRSTAPTERVLLASKQQPDGASAPPAAVKKTAATNEQPDTPESTHTAGQTGGGAPRGGATDKQIKYLELLADRVGADHAEDLWRAADPKCLQAQIKAAIPFKDLKVKHTHRVDVEAVTIVWNDEDDGLGASKSCIQRCICGAARSVSVSNVGGVCDRFDGGWKLLGHIVNYDIYSSELLAVTVSDEEQTDHDTGADRIIELTDRWRARQMPMSYVAALVQSLPKYGEGWIDSVVPVDRLDG